ncbi:Uncharacterized protein Fot_30038 [Forsythia ovata]|uniref:RNA polymerase-associated protein LEO1 n=1 Tax=Forsythia ovata TaxID=205694 RepID=A0ABD1TTL2_9LAMI
MVRGKERNQIMQDLFGYLSEEEVVKSQDALNFQPNSNEEDGWPKPEGVGRREGQGEAGLESDGEPEDVNHIREENKFINPSSLEVCTGNERESEGSRSSGDRNDDNRISHIAAVIRDIFGEFDDEEQAEHTVQNQIEDEEKKSLVDEERDFEKELMPEDIVPDEGVPYKPEEEYAEAESEEKDGLSLVLEIPSHHPLADPNKMHMIKLSNIVGIDPKPFDPSTYVAQDFFATDKSGSRRRIPPKNIIRWRNVKNPDGTTSVESNSRFVRWSDGSLQLLIGKESFDVSEQDIHDIQTHVFSIHEKEILQCEGRIKKKMHFMPSSLTSDPHRTLSALVDARNKKLIKVRSCIAEIDPEWEIEYKKKAERKVNKANKQRSRKKGKVIHMHKQTVDREQHQLKPDFLEDAINEVPKHSFKFVFSAASSSRRPIDLLGSKEKESNYKSKGKEYGGSPSDRNSRETQQNCEEGKAFEERK